jgi:predicted dehydrogenase
MSDSEISILMVGCGAFARRYHLPAIDEDPALRIAGIFDPQPAPETRELAERYGAPLVASIKALPVPAGTAFVLITTPHTLHAGHVDAMLDRRLDVLVDKPFVMTSADAERLAQRADILGVVNGVAYNRRFDRGCLRAREIIASGGIGEVRFVQTVQLGYERAGWFLVPELGGGGPYTGRATHMADLLPWLIGREPTRLRSRLRVSSRERSDHGGFIELLFGDLECQMTCIEEGWHMWDEVRIFGDDGLVELRRPLTVPIGWEMTWLSQRGGTRELVEADSESRRGDARLRVGACASAGRPACTFGRGGAERGIIGTSPCRSAREGGGWLDIGAEPDRLRRTDP